MNKLSKSFFLISFLPALAYWYLEAYYPVRIAISGGLALACIELFLEKRFTGHLHSLSKFNFYLIAFLGGISLIGDEGIWFKLQPMFTGLGIGFFLMYKAIGGKGLLFEMMESLGPKLPPEEIFRGLEKRIAVFFVGYGIFMGAIALYATTDRWLFFKTLGFYVIFTIFLIFEMGWFRWQLKRFYNRPIKSFREKHHYGR